MATAGRSYRCARADAKNHIALLDGFEVAPLVDGTGLDHALDAGGALLAALHQAAQSDRRIGGTSLSMPCNSPLHSSVPLRRKYS